MTFKEKHEAEARAAGLELIGKGDTRLSRLYRFISCGHERQLRLSAVRDGQVKCIECHKKRYEDEAEAVGLELIGSGRNKDHRLYRFKCCGAIADIGVCNVRAGYVRCPECSPDGRGGYDNKKAGSLYVIHYITEDGREFIKYGITNKDVVSRSNRHVTGTTTSRVDILFSIKWDDGSVAQRIESALDSLRKRVGGYEHQPTDLASGWTETLSMEHLSEIKKTVNEEIGLTFW